MFTPEEYQRLHRELLQQIERVRTAHRATAKRRQETETDWAEWYARALVRDLERLLPRGWTVPALRAELRRAEAERRAQQPGMDSSQYYAEWLLVRIDRGETP
ncbi:MAG TPA: hypothetical protein VE399_04590 [Gemmatimonadales bacterium]|nr:hypothetical protein [Gemmatimonadales bacterium]